MTRLRSTSVRSSAALRSRQATWAAPIPTRTNSCTAQMPWRHKRQRSMGGRGGSSSAICHHLGGSVSLKARRGRQRTSKARPLTAHYLPVGGPDLLTRSASTCACRAASAACRALPPFATPFALPVACRFSNGQPRPFADKTADVRGVALKFFSPEGSETDLLVTNEGGRSHARDAESFMAFADVLVAKIEHGAVGAVEELLQELRAGALSVGAVAHIGAVLLGEVGCTRCAAWRSRATGGRWSRWSGAAFKYSLRPADPSPSPVDVDRDRPDHLREELMSRLASAPVTWELCVQIYRDEERTPVNDASKVWSAEPIAIGALEIASTPSAEVETAIDRMAFNPGNGFE